MVPSQLANLICQTYHFAASNSGHNHFTSSSVVIITNSLTNPEFWLLLIQLSCTSLLSPIRLNPKRSGFGRYYSISLQRNILSTLRAMYYVMYILLKINCDTRARVYDNVLTINQHRLRTGNCEANWSQENQAMRKTYYFSESSV